MTGELPHILVVDDDQRLRDLLRMYLSGNGFVTATAADAAEARQQLKSLTFDLIVLDIMMPGENGLEFVRSLRKEAVGVPVLLLTAMGETEDRIIGLESGADDYLSKPFEPRELVLRINSILRRLPQTGATGPVQTTLKLGIYQFDAGRNELSDAEGVIHLTTAESTLLGILAVIPGEAMSREELAARTGNSGNPRAIDVQVMRLRRKIEDDPRLPRYLQTVRGQGYMLLPD